MANYVDITKLIFVAKLVDVTNSINTVDSKDVENLLRDAAMLGSMNFSVLRTAWGILNSYIQ